MVGNSESESKIHLLLWPAMASFDSSRNKQLFYNEVFALSTTLCISFNGYIYMQDNKVIAKVVAVKQR